MREDVLRIDFQPVFDNYAWKITYQNENVLERGKFYDKDLNCESCNSPEFGSGFLYIRGDKKNDEKINFCSLEEKTIIEEIVKNINKKYGILKPWRGRQDEQYFYIDTHNGCIAVTNEKGFEDDNFNYGIGNYFKTTELAEKFIKDLEQFSRDWHNNNNNNNKD